SGAWDVQPFKRRMIAHNIRGLTMGDLPHHLTFIQIDGRDGSVRRLDQRDAVYVQSAATATSAAWSCWRAISGWQRRIGSGVFARPGAHLNPLSGGSSHVIHI